MLRRASARPPPTSVAYYGDDSLGFVIAKNLRRRHLTESQRAMVATRLVKLPKGVRSDTEISASATTQAQAANMLNVSPDSVHFATNDIPVALG